MKTKEQPNPTMAITKFSKLLADSGMSKSELARQIGISNAYVTWLVQGKREPRIRMIPKIAQAFGLSNEIILNLFL